MRLHHPVLWLFSLVPLVTPLVAQAAHDPARIYQYLESIAGKISPENTLQDATHSLAFSLMPDFLEPFLDAGMLDPNQPTRYWTLFSGEGFRGGEKNDYLGGKPTVQTPVWQIAALTGNDDIIATLLKRNIKLTMASIDGVSILDILKKQGKGIQLIETARTNAHTLSQASEGTIGELIATPLERLEESSSSIGSQLFVVMLMNPVLKPIQWLAPELVPGADNESVTAAYKKIIQRLEARKDLWQ